MPNISKILHNTMAVDRSFKDLVQEHNKETAKYELGEVRITAKNSRHFGVYQYVKANEAVARGKVVTAVPWATWDTTTVVDYAANYLATAEIIHIDTNTSAYTANQYRGYWIRQAAGAGPLGGAMQIASHIAIAASDEGDLNMERAIGETLADGTALEIFNPYLMELVDGDTEEIQGVAFAAFTSAYYGWVQIGGFVPAVLVGHNPSAAVVLNEPLVPVAGVPGACQGMAGATEPDIMELAMSPLKALAAVAANTVCYIPAKMAWRG